MFLNLPMKKKKTTLYCFNKQKKESLSMLKQLKKDVTFLYFKQKKLGKL